MSNDGIMKIEPDDFIRRNMTVTELHAKRATENVTVYGKWGLGRGGGGESAAVITRCGMKDTVY
jgi:hypothetical protein